MVLQQREKPPEDGLLHGTTGPTVQNYSGNAEATAYRRLVLKCTRTLDFQGTMLDFFLCLSAPSSLISLRQNVSRLLVTTVPALDLEQVNYECNVIDEILEQIIMDTESG